jgi:hypothetical protein
MRGTASTEFAGNLSKSKMLIQCHPEDLSNALDLLGRPEGKNDSVGEQALALSALKDSSVAIWERQLLFESRRAQHHLL